MNKKYISWQQFGIMVEELAMQIKEDFLGRNMESVFDGIFGPPRGGWPIAVYMSHKFNLPIVICPTENTLVVDDISDTGITLQNIKHRKIATLFSTDWTITPPDYFVDKKLNKDEWIVYPWENDMKKDERQTILEEFK